MSVERRAPRASKGFWRRLTQTQRALVVVGLLTAPVTVPVLWSFVECPWVGWYDGHFPEETSFMAYRHDQAEAKGKKFTLRYKPVPLSQISPAMARAVVVGEDAGFYQHGGIEWDAIRKAYEANSKKGKVVRGGSTISQQLAKNLWLTPKRSLWRKGIEAILTYRMEWALSKPRIMELYLNVIEWGDGIFGVHAAARAYFGTTPDKLTQEQAAMLAAAIPSPLKSNPSKPSAYLLKRRDRILAIMQGRKVADE